MALAQFKEVDVNSLMLNPFKEIDQWMLATSGSDVNDCNGMTISWGGLGVYMSVPITNVYIRKTRHTYNYFRENDYFTVCTFDPKYKKELGHMGTKSGRDENKWLKTGLKPMMVDKAVGVEQAKRIYVCEKIYSGPIKREGIKEGELKEKFYNKEIPDDYHIMFMGKIIKVLDRIDSEEKK